MGPPGATGAVGATGPAGVPCSNGCVNDASIADRLVRVPMTCVPTANGPDRGPYGYFFIGSGVTLSCSAPIPLDFVSSANVTVEVIHRIVLSTAARMDVAPAIVGAAIPNNTLPNTVVRTAALSVVDQVVNWTQTFTAAEIFGAGGAGNATVLLQVTQTSRGWEIFGVNMVYTANR